MNQIIGQTGWKCEYKPVGEGNVMAEIPLQRMVIFVIDIELAVVYEFLVNLQLAQAEERFQACPYRL